jgi:hypothetical protein
MHVSEEGMEAEGMTDMKIEIEIEDTKVEKEIVLEKEKIKEAV